MRPDPIWLELASFDPVTGRWQRQRLLVAQAALAAGDEFAVGAGVVLDIHVPHVAPQPLRFMGAVLSTVGDQTLVEGDPEASGPLIDALPELEPFGFFALVPAKAFR
ncbi:MAG: hypothetical protein WCA12_04270 [Burkholderiales bacterium]